MRANGWSITALLKLSPASWAIILASVTLSLIGLIVFARLADGTGPTSTFAPGYLKRQAAYLAVSLIAMLAVSKISYLRIGRWAYPLFALTIALLFAVLVFGHLGQSAPVVKDVFPKINGSCRWIKLPFFQIQPSELVKLSYILALAMYLRYRSNYRRFLGLIEPFAFTLLPMILILLEPDLGTVMLLFPVLFLTLFAAGAKTRHLVAIVALMVLASPLLYFKMADYQKGRLAGVLLQSPKVRAYLEQHPRVKQAVCPGESLRRWEPRQGYQLHHSKMAVGSGGVLGFPGGPGPYTSGAYHLPESHNDFVFSIIGHQFGFVGSLLVIGLYGIIVVSLIEIAGVVVEPFGRLIVVGTFAMILTQAAINMAMTIGLMPITGVTLPFVSYGGSSLLTFFILIGLCVSVDRTRPVVMGPRPFEFPDDDA